MPVFRFRMQSMLNLRQQVEEQTKNRMAVAMNRLQMEKDKLMLFKEEKRTVTEELNREASSGITVSNIRRFNAYIGHLNEKVDRQNAVVKQHIRNADKIREELIKAMQDRKVLEKLRERKYEEFGKELLRMEQRAVDELISYKNSISSKTV